MTPETKGTPRTQGTQGLEAAAAALIDENLASMRAIVAVLGDEHLTTTPPLAGANSPFAIVFHCVGVLSFWCGSVIGGEKIPRDRAAEFSATGSKTELIDALDDMRGRVPAWVHIAVTEGVRDRDVAGSTRTGDVADAGPEWILFHVVRELSQHLGQLELTRDTLLAPG